LLFLKFNTIAGHSPPFMQPSYHLYPNGFTLSKCGSAVLVFSIGLMAKAYPALVDTFALHDEILNLN